MDITSLSAKELRELQQKIVLELKKREHEEVAKAREQIMAIAQNLGIPLKELLQSTTRAKMPKVATKYRHPSNTALQWSGRGRQPAWIKEWLASGQGLDALR